MWIFFSFYQLIPFNLQNFLLEPKVALTKELVYLSWCSVLTTKQEMV